MRTITCLFAVVLVLTGCDAVPDLVGVDPPTPTFAVSPAPPLEAVDLGTLGGTYSVAFKINNRGEVVGMARTADQVLHPFFWSRATGMVDLMNDPALSRGAAGGINETGEVAFTARFTDGTSALYSWTAGAGAQPLTPLVGPASVSDMNESGVIVGGDADGGFRWSPGAGLERLDVLITDTPGYEHSHGFGINDAGVIVTRSSGAGAASFFWTPGSGSIQIMPDANPALGREVNNAGQVAVERWDRSPAFVISGQRWAPDGSATEVGPTSSTYIRPWGINEAGQLAGGFDGSASAFIWDEAGGITLLPSVGGSYGLAYDINDQGSAAGFSSTAEGLTHATLWRDPVTFVLLDVLPGSDVNPINLKSKGKLPVAVLSSDDFDAAEVDVASVTLVSGDAVGTPVARKKKGQLHASLEDIDGDGHDDLVMHFDRQELQVSGGLSSSTAELCLAGTSTDGRAISGCDAVRVR